MYFRCSSLNRNTDPRLLPRDNGLKWVLHLEHMTDSQEMLINTPLVVVRDLLWPTLSGWAGPAHNWPLLLWLQLSSWKPNRNQLSLSCSLSSTHPGLLSSLSVIHTPRPALIPASSSSRTGVRPRPTSARRVNHRHCTKQMGGSASQSSSTSYGVTTGFCLFSPSNAHTDPGNKRGYNTV